MVIIASNDAMKKNQLSSMTQVSCTRKNDPKQDIRKHICVAYVCAELLLILKTFKATIYSSLQLIIM